MQLTNASLHHRILSTVVDRGYAPTHTELGAWFERPVGEIIAALEALADYHGVVLHPDSMEIWVVHPFSLAPTAYIVTTDDGKWWGTCAWCSLGAVELLGGSATITTQLAWSDEQVTLRLDHGKLLDTDYVVHFPIPMTQAWDNVLYTCSMMLFFKDRVAVEQWCNRFGKDRGDVRPIQQIWEFSREWYGRHLDQDWQKWSTDEASEMFARHGLEGPIWNLESSADRF